MIYGNKLKDLREIQNIKQKEIANNLNISNKTYSAYEIEYEIAPSKHLIAIADYLEVSLDYLLDLSNELQYNNSKKGYDKVLSGKRLKEIRKELKLSQTILAEELKTSYGTLSGYERGRYLIATPFLYDICKKYRISADYLLGKIDNPKYLNK